MSRLFVTADIHGSLGAWKTLMDLMEPGDDLAVAGDLFDTRYGHTQDPDFQPDVIRNDMAAMEHRVHYVYGNCDEASYYPSGTHALSFCYKDREILIHHGHFTLISIPEATGIVIQGHTHLSSLEHKSSRIHLNPGSLARPKNGLYTYAMIDDTRVSLMDLKTGHPLACLELDRATTLHQSL